MVVVEVEVEVGEEDEDGWGDDEAITTTTAPAGTCSACTLPLDVEMLNCAAWSSLACKT